MISRFYPFFLVHIRGWNVTIIIRFTSRSFKIGLSLIKEGEAGSKFLGNCPSTGLFPSRWMVGSKQWVFTAFAASLESSPKLLPVLHQRSPLSPSHSVESPDPQIRTSNGRWVYFSLFEPFRFGVNDVWHIAFFIIHRHQFQLSSTKFQSCYERLAKQIPTRAPSRPNSQQLKHVFILFKVQWNRCTCVITECLLHIYIYICRIISGLKGKHFVSHKDGIHKSQNIY